MADDIKELVVAALPAYDVGDELGRGGMGIVLEGRQTALDRQVAIKELPTSLATTPEVRDRFRSEAQLLAKMDHSHIVPVYDYVENDALCLLVMEHLPGGTVWGRFTTDGLSQDASCAITLAACEALHYAHEHKVLHRDMKPENVMFTGEGIVKVTDFGIAEVLGGDDLLATTNGDILGTPAYIAPEQAEGGQLGPPADVYATGVMLYEFLSGQLPYSEEGGALAIVFRHANEDHIPLESVAPGVPAPIAAVVSKSLQRNPADRYQTSEAFGVALAEAAAAAWGPTWLDDTDFKVRVSGPIAAAAHRTTSGGPVAAPVAPPTPAPSAAPPASGDARSTSALGGPPAAADWATSPLSEGSDQSGGDGDARSTSAVGGPPVSPLPPAASTGGDARSTFASGGPPVSPPTPPSGKAATVRPSDNSRGAIGPARRVDADQLVPVSDVLRPPPPPTKWRLGALALILLAVLLAAIGGSDPGASGDTFVAGSVLFDGDDVMDSGIIGVNFGGPVVVDVSDDLLDNGVVAVQVSVAVAGVTVPGSTDVPIEPDDDGNLVAIVDSPLLGFTVGGPSEATIDLLDADGTVVGSRTVAIGPELGGVVTIGTVLAGVLLIVALAYTESLIRPMRRRGRRRLGSMIGLGIVGFLCGVSFSILGWTLLGAPLTIVWTMLVALVGTAAFCVLGVSSAKVARRKRVQMIIEKKNLQQFFDAAA